MASCTDDRSDEPVDLFNDAAPHLLQPIGSRCEPDAGEDVLGVEALGIEGRGGGELTAVRQIDEGGHEGGGADVDHQAEALGRGIALFDDEKFAPDQDGGYMAVRIVALDHTGAERYIPPNAVGGGPSATSHSVVQAHP
nr:hypothetical protein [Geobacter sp.]